MNSGNLNKITNIGTYGSSITNDVLTRQYDSIRIGTYAGKYLKSSNNIFIGDKAGQNSYDVVNSIFLGYNAGANITNGDRNIIIGYNLNNEASNSITIGNNYTSTLSTTIGDLNENKGSYNTLIGYRSCNYGNNLFTIGENLLIKNLDVFYHNGFEDKSLSNISFNSNFNLFYNDYSSVLSNIENSNTFNPFITNIIEFQKKNLINDFIQPFLKKDCQIIQGIIHLVYDNSTIPPDNSNISFNQNQLYNLINYQSSLSIPISIIKRFAKPILNIINNEITFDNFGYIPNINEYEIKYLISSPPNFGTFLDNIANKLEFNSSNLVYISYNNFTDINDSCGISPLLFIKNYPDDIIKGDEVFLNFNRVFSFSEFIPNPPIIIDFLRDIEYVNQSIDINVISFDYVFLKSHIISNISNISSYDTSKIIINFYQYPNLGFICDINRNPIASINFNDLNNIIYQNYDNNLILDSFNVNISYSSNYANINNFTMNIHIINSNEITYRNAYIYDEIPIKNNIIYSKYPTYIIENSSLINIENYYELLRNKSSVSLKLATTNNNFILFDNQNFYNYFGTFQFNIIRNKFISSNVLIIPNKSKYDYQFLNYQINNQIFSKKLTISFNFMPKVEFPFSNINNIYNFNLSFYENKKNLKSINYNHSNYPLPFNSFSKIINIIDNDIDIKTTTDIRFEFFLSSNLNSYDYFQNYPTKIIIRDVSISYENYDINNFGVSIGKDLTIEGLNNLIIGSNMNIIGNNSIIIGNNNSKNPIFESIIIGKNNFQNNYSKNSLIIGNNNSTEIINKHQIIIGNDIHNKYLLNIDNTILRDSNKILIGIDEIPVAIGYNSNDIIDISDKNSLYLKNGVVLNNIHFQNSNNFKTSLIIPETLTSNITYTLPIIPNEFSRILLTTDNQGNLKWTETSTFDLNTNLNISNLYSSNIYVSGYLFGDGRYLSNVNISDKNTDDLIEGSNNLYYTDKRASNIFFNFISNISTDNIKEGSNNLYYTSLRDSNSFYSNLNNITTDNLKQGYSNLYYNYNYLSNAILTNFATLTTNDLKEGSSNLYITPARVDEILYKKTTDNFKEGSNNRFFTNEYANSNISRFFSTITTDNVKEGSANLYFNNQRLSSNITQILRTKNTDDIKEGNINRYFNESNVNYIYSNLLRTKTTADIQEVGSNLYFNLDRFNSYLQTKNTDDIREGTSNFFLTTQKIISLLSTLNSDNIKEGSTNLYYKEIYARQFLIKSQNLLSTDLIKEGTSNRYIVNNTYPTNLTIDGKINASNVFINNSNILDIYQESVINAKFNYAKTYSTNFTTSNLNVNPKTSLHLNLNVSCNQSLSFAGIGCPLIVVGSNVGINNLNPFYNLHTRGYAYADYLLGDGFNITNLDINKIAFNADDVKNGTSNRLITNNIYDRGLTIEGDLIFNNAFNKGDVIPFIDNSYNLGNTNSSFSNIYVNNLKLNNLNLNFNNNKLNLLDSNNNYHSNIINFEYLSNSPIINSNNSAYIIKNLIINNQNSNKNPLEIINNNSQVLLISSNNDIKLNTNLISLKTSNHFFNFQKNNNDLIINNNDYLQLFFTSNSNIGIGLSNPNSNYLLDVNGTINCLDIFINDINLGKKLSITSNELVNFTIYNSNQTSNNTFQTSNNLINFTIQNSNQTSNNTFQTSNNLIDFTLYNSNKSSNYTYQTSNNLIDITLYNSNQTSNNTYQTSNNLIDFTIQNSNDIFINSSNFTYNTATKNINYNDLLNQSWINSGTNIYNNSTNVGIGTIIPNSKLHIYESTGTISGANSGTIILDHDNIKGASSIVFRSKVNRGSDYGYIQYQDASSVGGSGENARLIIGIQNDIYDHLLLMPSGNVGVNNANPSYKLDVYGSINTSSFLNLSSTALSGITWNNRGLSGIVIAGATADYSPISLNGDMIIRSDTNKKIIFQNGNSLTPALTIDSNIIDSCNYSIKNINISNIFVSSNVFENNSNSLFNFSFQSSNNLINFTINNSNDAFNNSYNILNTFIKNSYEDTFNKINEINTDNIKSGTSNKFIINNIYNDDLTITKNFVANTITTSNLNIIGDFTSVETNVYQTEQLQVINEGTATSLIVNQMGINQNSIEVYNNNNISLIINSNANVGIGISNPNYKLDVNGIINSTSLFINNTDVIQIINNNSNSLTSNILFNSNDLFNYSSIKFNDTNQLFSSNISYTSNNLFKNINDLTSTNISYTSNNLFKNINDLTSYTSNKLFNEINDISSSNIYNTSNYLFEYSSNSLFEDVDQLTSNINQTSNNLFNYSSNTSNSFFKDINILTSSNISYTSNNLFNYSSNTSNSLFKDINILTSANLTSNINQTSNNLFNYSSNTSNSLFKDINILTSSNISYTSNNLFNYSSNTSNSLFKDINQLTSANLTSNINQTSNNLFNYSSNTSNSLFKDINQLTSANLTSNINQTSNNLFNYSSNTSNSLFKDINQLTSANLTSNISFTSNNLFNYSSNTSNSLFKDINQLTSSNISFTSNNLFNYSSNTSNSFFKDINILTSSNIIQTSNSLLNEINSNKLFINSTSNNLFNNINQLTSANLNSSILNSSNELNFKINSNTNYIIDFSRNYSNNLFNDIEELSINTNQKFISNNTNLNSIITSNNTNVLNNINITSNNLFNYSKNNYNNLDTKITSNTNFLFDYSYKNSNKNYLNINATSASLNQIITSNTTFLFKYSSNNYNDFIKTIKEINIENNLSTDTIHQGTSNRFIVNHNYNNDVFFNSNLYASNIVASNITIIGKVSIFETNIYKYEQFEVINNSTATSLTIKQLGFNRNVAEFYNYQNLSFVINSNANVGIGVANPRWKLDVDGTINCSDVTINDISLITTINNEISSTSNFLYQYSRFNFNNLTTLSTFAYNSTLIDFAQILSTISYEVSSQEFITTHVCVYHKYMTDSELLIQADFPYIINGFGTDKYVSRLEISSDYINDIEHSIEHEQVFIGYASGGGTRSTTLSPIHHKTCLIGMTITIKVQIKLVDSDDTLVTDKCVFIITEKKPSYKLVLTDYITPEEVVNITSNLYVSPQQLNNILQYYQTNDIGTWGSNIDNSIYYQLANVGIGTNKPRELLDVNGNIRCHNINFNNNSNLINTIDNLNFNLNNASNYLYTYTTSNVSNVSTLSTFAYNSTIVDFTEFISSEYYEVSSSNYTDTHICYYTKYLSDSELLIQADFPYTINGFGTDSYSSRLEITTEIIDSPEYSIEHEQRFIGFASGGGTRSTTLSPIIHKTAVGGMNVIIKVQIKLNDSDDSLITDKCLFIITEKKPTKKLIFIDYTTPNEVIEITSNIYISSNYFSNVIKNYQTNDVGVWTSNIDGSIYFPDANVGIGTNNPLYNLDIIGSLNTTELFIDNNNFNTILSNTCNFFNYKIDSLNADLIDDGNNNRFIINDVYNRDIYLNHNTYSSNLITSNLIIRGDFTRIETPVYQTKQFKIDNFSNSTAFIINQHRNNQNIVEFYNSGNISFLINPSGNIGIHNSNPNYELDINGEINCSNVNINNISILDTIALQVASLSNSLITHTISTFGTLQNSNLIGFNTTLVDFKTIISSNVYLITSSNFTNTHSCYYKKFFRDSEIHIQADFPYKISGYGSDHFASRIEVISDYNNQREYSFEYEQIFIGYGAGGGTRSTTLSPINFSTSMEGDYLTINLQLCLVDSDDSIFTDKCVFIITEKKPTSKLQFSSYLTEADIPDLTSNLYINPLQLQQILLNYQTNNYGKWESNVANQSIYYNVGKVGIGSYNPYCELDVNGEINCSDININKVSLIDTFNNHVSITSNALIDFTINTFNNLQNSNLIGYNSTLVDFKSFTTSNVFIVNSSLYTSTHSCVYTKFFDEGELLIQADFPYKINGFGSDIYASRLIITSDANNIVEYSLEHEQIFVGFASGGGTRSTTLSPLSHKTNIFGKNITIKVQMRLVDSDDSIYTDKCVFIITEKKPSSRLILSSYLNEGDIPRLTSNLYINSNQLSNVLKNYQTNDIGKWTSNIINKNIYYEGIGKVGIGTTNPSYKLDVNGTLNCQEVYRNGIALKTTLLDYVSVNNIRNVFNNNVIGYGTTLVDMDVITTYGVYNVSSSNYVNTHTYTYTKFFNDSEVIIQAEFPYIIEGFGSDRYSSRLAVWTDTNLSPQYSLEHEQVFIGYASGGGTRSTTLSPLNFKCDTLGRNVYIAVQLKLTDSDDMITTEKCNFIIYEKKNKSALQFKNYVNEYDVVTLTSNLYINPYQLNYSLSNYQTNDYGKWNCNLNDTNIYYNIGNVGIGTANPITNLDVQGNIVATGQIVSSFSDIRLKTITSKLTNALDIIGNINGFKYKPNDIALSYGFEDKEEVGLNAQEVSNYINEIVSLAPFDMLKDENGDIISKTGNNYLTIQYEKLIPYLIEGIKELKKENELLNNRLKKIENILFN